MARPRSTIISFILANSTAPCGAAGSREGRSKKVVEGVHTYLPEEEQVLDIARLKI